MIHTLLDECVAELVKIHKKYYFGESPLLFRMFRNKTRESDERISLHYSLDFKGF